MGGSPIPASQLVTVRPKPILDLQRASESDGYTGPLIASMVCLGLVVRASRASGEDARGVGPRAGIAQPYRRSRSSYRVIAAAFADAGESVSVAEDAVDVEPESIVTLKQRGPLLERTRMSGKAA